MVMLLLLSFLIGAVLGMRFKVLVLVPAIAGTLPIAVAVEISHQQGLASIILVSAATVALAANWLFGRNCRSPWSSHCAHECA